jgi:hypothetical protein
MHHWEKAWRGRSLILLVAALALPHWLGAALLLAGVGGALAVRDMLDALQKEHWANVVQDIQVADWIARSERLRRAGKAAQEQQETGAEDKANA